MLLTIGASLNETVLTPDFAARGELIRRVERVGLDYVSVGDHISFHVGTGFDGIVMGTTVLATSASLGVRLGVYLLGLRHPMLAARSLASMAEMAPGRVVLGVGVAGEDRREVENAGVDPRTRGRRLDEALGLVIRLLDGETVTHRGEFFALDEALILPTPSPRIPILVGGKGDPAVERTARFGDGWLGMFCSARRYRATIEQIGERSAELGRAPQQHAFNVWVGIDRSPARARELLDARLESIYRLPGGRFQNVAPAGTPEQVADWLRPFVDAGATSISIGAVSESDEAAVDHLAEVAALLRA